MTSLIIHMMLIKSFFLPAFWGASQGAVLINSLAFITLSLAVFFLN